MNNYREHSRTSVDTSQIEDSALQDQSALSAVTLDLNSPTQDKLSSSTHGPRSQRVLSSWKEIASFLGKGVRTVQRWEQKHGLPVRRPQGHIRIVLAYPEELEHWMGPIGRKHSESGANHDDTVDSELADIRRT